MARLPALFAVTMTLLTGSGAVNVEILEPIRATGDEVGLIFIPDAFIEGEDYNKTAQAIQAASELRMWVALTMDYMFDAPNSQQLPGAIQKAIDALDEAGMIYKNFIGVGHGSGGYTLQRYVANSQDHNLKAIVLLGACLERDTRLQDYPVPVLTLAAELDGITRITRVVEEYGKLKDDLKTSFLALYKTPVILVEGANHDQFASGSLSQIGWNKEDQLTPEVTTDEAHREIGKHVNSFLTATFVSSPDKNDKALAELEEAFFDSNNKFQPFLDIKDLDINGNFSQWTILAQERIAGRFADQIQIENEVGDFWSFMGSQPSITTIGDLVIVKTLTLLDFDEHSTDLDSRMKSPIEIMMKLKSKDSIWEAVAGRDSSSGPRASLKGEPATCKSLNEFALEIALKHSSPAAQNRYKTKGLPIIFEDDYVTWFELTWKTKALQTWEDDKGLHVRAIAYDNPSSGLHACRLISPYRAMEWVNIDSLV